VSQYFFYEDGEIGMSNEKRNFDQEATQWDQNPGRLKVAADIGQAIIEQMKLSPDMDVLDFGCGTGLLTLVLQPFVRSIIGVDSSQGMLDVFKVKIKEQSLNNVKADYIDPDKGDLLAGSYHLVVSSMTLHHIKEIGPLLKQFYRVLHPSGCLCIADLDLDDGQFHGDNKGVFHFGFNREALRRMFEDAGFRDIQTSQAASIEKPVGDGKSRLFTIFLMIARK
jgi:ubiquinone/menaquinone biosynthesis C-methylase UbiE